VWKHGEVVKGFHGSGHAGLITLPSLCSLTADSNRLRQRRKKKQARVEIDPHHEEPRWTLSTVGLKARATSTHPSPRRPYVPSRFDGSSDADADADPLRKDSTDSNSNSLSSREMSSIPA